MLTISDFREPGMPVRGAANTPDEAAALAVTLGIGGHAYFEARRETSIDEVFVRSAQVEQMELDLDAVDRDDDLSDAAERASDAEARASDAEDALDDLEAKFSKLESKVRRLNARATALLEAVA